VDGEFTPFDFPGASASLPTMEAKGILVGGYTVGSSPTQGFLFVDGLYVTLVCPNTTSTFWSGIDAQSRIAVANDHCGPGLQRELEV